uniref:Uncharacterized protein n=1 Tax=Rhizophora mucronata TaxID=61149 RepID=A0A2P2PS17_RHIMU
MEQQAHREEHTRGAQVARTDLVLHKTKEPVLKR